MKERQPQPHNKKNHQENLKLLTGRWRSEKPRINGKFRGLPDEKKKP